MKSYRITFDRLINKKYYSAYMDVYANNAKEAKDLVLELTYQERSNKFYPFHRKAKRINANEMVHGMRWI